MRKEDQARAAIRRFMAERKINAFAWTKSAGISEGTLRNYLNDPTGNKTLTLNTLQRLADAQDSTIAEIIGEKPREQKLGRSVTAIKSLEIRSSLGGGFNIVEEPEGQPFFFQRDWIANILQSHPGRLRVHYFEGDSMLPTISDGDVGLIHLDWGHFEPGIWDIWDGAGIVTKRVEMVPAKTPTLRISSDNPVWKPQEVDAEAVRLIGRVIWRGGGL